MRNRSDLGALLLSVGATVLLVSVTRADDTGPTADVGWQPFLTAYCFVCHEGDGAEAQLDLSETAAAADLVADREIWQRVLRRVANGEMPPADADTPSENDRNDFVRLLRVAVIDAACAEDVSPGPAPVRRLTRSQYAATMRDLLRVAFDAGHALPADGSGGEGFDNAAETLFLSPIHTEVYLQAAEQAVDYAIKDGQSRPRRRRSGSGRSKLFSPPGEDESDEDAARAALAGFLPRAFRRPVKADDVERYVRLFRSAQNRGESFDISMKFALCAALIAPDFLFRLESPNPETTPQLIGDYELATRLSYFLWNSMPDDELFELASRGRLNSPEELERQVARMLKDTRSIDFAQSFIEQWLGTRRLGTEIRPDDQLFPQYDKELESALKYEPILFFQEIVASNLSLLNLIDANFTFGNNKLARLYGLPKNDGQPMVRLDLPEDSQRGGVLGMGAVHVITSYPHRTSPVLRGVWVLDTLLGDPPPPPPPDVPELEENQDRREGTTLRERLVRHRTDPSCAGCHDRIDPLGIGLENFDMLGQWRDKDAGQPVDSRGELPDGTHFNGLEGLKAVLLSKTDQFLRNFTAKMLGYALGRGLTVEDQCIVEEIAATVASEEFNAQALIREIVCSVPFRYKAPAAPPHDATDSESQS